jgi:DNA-binding Xre family transcriptional regulator
MHSLKNISGKEMANAIGKTPAAISYLKKKHVDEYSLLKIGVLCKKLNLDDEDLMAMFSLKQIELKRVAS